MSTFKHKLLAILLDVMRPFARLMINAGVSYREFEELSRKAFVDVTWRDQAAAGKTTSSGKISLITGLSRQEVVAIQSMLDAEDGGRVSLRSVPSDVLHFWQHDSDYLSESGVPLLLTFEGEKPSFRSLVDSYAAGSSAAAIRDALLEVGSIAKTEEGQLRFVKAYFIPAASEERLLISLRQNIRALLSTVAYNSDVPRKRPGRIERFVYTDGLTDAQIKEFSSAIRDNVKKYTEDVDKEFSKLEELNRQKGQQPAGRTVAVGVYFFEEDEYSK